MTESILDTEAAKQLVERDRHNAAGELAAAGAINANLTAAGVDVSKVDYRKAFTAPDDPAAAQAELTRLQGDKAFVDSLFDHAHPLHRANVALRQVLLDKATGAPVEPEPTTSGPERYTVNREGFKAEEWDSEAEGVFREVADALGFDQAGFDQVVYAWNTVARQAPLEPAAIESATIACADAMARRYGDRLPAMRAAFDEMLGSLSPDQQEAARYLLNSSGLGSSIPFVSIALERAAAWKQARAGAAKR